MQVPRGKVLVVEDERVLAMALERLLAPLHDVRVALRANEAVAQIEAGDRFHVILCDLMLPEMTGMELHAVLLRVAPDQAKAMVFMSGTFNGAARDFLGRVPNASLEKPFESQHLVRLVNERIA